MHFIGSVLLALFLFSRNVYGLFEFTNIKCESYDKPFAEFDYCYLKSVNRSYKYLSLKVILHQLPITNISVSVAMKRKANGYKPFLYNFTFDACKFLKNRKTPNLVLKYAFAFVEKHSNINHTCPYNHDLVVEKVDANFLNNQFTKVLPWPKGEYGLFTTWIAYNKPRADANIFFKIDY